MKKNKITLLAVVLLVLLLIGGIFAYFTDITSTTTNVFTLGNVDITLTEPNWDYAQDGKTIMPGETVDKDPTITNAGNDDAFVFVQVSIPYYSVQTVAEEANSTPAHDQELFTYTLNNGWVEVGTAAVDSTNHKKTHVFAYTDGNGAMAPLAVNGAATVFDDVTFIEINDASATAITTNNVSLDIDVTGYGIQANGLASDAPADVWAEF